MYNNEPLDEVVDRVAWAINPLSFKQWQSMYDYCIRHGDDEQTARRYADVMHLPDIKKVHEQARAAIAAMSNAGWSEGVEALEWLAGERTIAELAVGTLSAWNNATPERRIEMMGARKRVRDAAIEKARAAIRKLTPPSTGDEA